MKPRLSRPLLAAAISAAIVAGGTVHASPAMAAGPAPAGTADAVTMRTEEPVPVPDPDETTTSPVPIPDPDETTTSPTVTPTTVSPTPTKTTVSPAPTKTTVAPAPDRVKPKATFRLSPTSVWVGQKITFAQNGTEFSDDRDTDSRITRKINWGDGSSTTLSASATSYARYYTRAGRFNVTETLTDRSGNSFTTPAKVVTVTVPGKYSLSRYTFYQGVPFYVNLGSVPSGTSKITVDWGDGWYSDHQGKSQSVRGRILHRKGTNSKISGKVTLRVKLTNKNGTSAWIKVGTANVLKDTARPVVTVTKPSSSNKVKSWKTIKGTVKDKGAGAPYVYVTVVRVTKAGKAYCLTPKKKWKRFTTQDQYENYCWEKGVAIKVNKGKWSLKLPAGLSKGTIHVDAWTWDWAQNYGTKVRQAKLTKS